MQKFTVKKKVAAGLGAGAMVVAGAGAAYAYWTTNGQGAGSASTGSVPLNKTAVTINQDTTTNPLGQFVLGQSHDVYVTATNNETYSVNVGAVTVAVNDVTDNDGNVVCASSNWSVTPSSNNVIGTIAGSSTSTTQDVATITLKDLANTNQDGCQNVRPTLTFTAGQGS